MITLQVLGFAIFVVALIIATILRPGRGTTIGWIIVAVIVAVVGAAVFWHKTYYAESKKVRSANNKVMDSIWRDFAKETGVAETVRADQGASDRQSRLWHKHGDSSPMPIRFQQAWAARLNSEFHDKIPEESDGAYNNVCSRLVKANFYLKRMENWAGDPVFPEMSDKKWFYYIDDAKKKILPTNAALWDYMDGVTGGSVPNPAQALLRCSKLLRATKTIN